MTNTAPSAFWGEYVTPQAAQYLQDMLADDTGKMRQVAANALAWHNTATVRRQIIDTWQTQSNQGDLYLYCCQVMEKMAHSDFLDPLCQRLPTCNLSQSKPIMRALAQIPSVKTAQAIVNWLQNNDIDLEDCQEAFDALVNTTTPIAEAFFRDLHQSDDPHAKTLGQYYLVEGGFFSTDELLSILNQSDETATDALIELLGDKAEAGRPPARLLITRAKTLVTEQPGNRWLLDGYAKMVVGWFEAKGENLTRPAIFVDCCKSHQPKIKTIYAPWPPTHAAG